MGTGTDTHGAAPALSADAYYNQSRADLTALLPLPLGNVLDVGCGAGGVGQHLARRPGERLVGVEINAEQAAIAAAHYDDVIVGSVPEAFDRVEGSFQTVLCYDVLEHLVDPATVLRTLSERLAESNAVLHVSVPNARHLSLVRDLVFRGTFGYRPYGHRDATHLRWFTRRDIVDLLESTGWRVDSVQTPVLKPSYRAAAAVSGGFAKDFLTIQWYVLARHAR